ncbi:hypothetical protein [Escherichia coli]
MDDKQLQAQAAFSKADPVNNSV